MTTKLVRDKVGELPWRHEQAKAALRFVHDETEFVSLLRQKLLEEVGEFLEAGNDVDAIEEAADILEVIHAILARRSIFAPIEQVIREHDRKREQRGGFERGLVLNLS